MALLRTLGHLIKSRAIFCYCDDVIIGGKSVGDVIHVLHSLLVEWHTAGLTLGIKKSKFLYDFCEFLGHRIISSEGIRIIPKYSTKIISDFASPTDQKSAARWLAFANFYRRSIYNFAVRTSVIRKLMSKNTPFILSNEWETAFRSINAELINPPTLRPIDRNKKVFIVVDGSTQGTAYSIYQINGKIPMPAFDVS